VNFSSDPFRRNEGGSFEGQSTHDRVHDDDLDNEPKRAKHFNRPALGIDGLVVLLFVAFVAWLDSEAIEAKSSLEQARTSAQQAQEALLTGGASSTTECVDKAQLHSTNANDATHSVPWKVASVVPWLGSNLSSHLPYAAQIWKSMWAQQTGMEVDGAIAVDPVALSYVLSAVGPVITPDGERITAENVVELTESTVYSRFPSDQVARKLYLQGAASEVVLKVTGGSSSPKALLEALGKAAGEGRIAVRSGLPVDQQLLERTPLAHIVPTDRFPYAEVVVINLGGNKLDCSLRRQIDYPGDPCQGDTRETTVTVRLTNSAPEGLLTEYVDGTGGAASELPVQLPEGTNVTSVALVGTVDAKLTSVLVDGNRASTFDGLERSHPVSEVGVAFPRGRTAEVRFLMTEPAASGSRRVPVQPLIDTVTPAVFVPTCAT
jgi:hypothetical protein